MGTFERIRKISPYALAAFVVIFVGFMVASDADISTLLQQGSNPQTAAIAYINGEKILYKDFQERVNQAIEQQRAQMQNPEAEIDQNQIMTQVWDQMVTEIILKQEAEKLGIKVTNNEIVDILIENPPDFLARSFTDTAGNLNKQIYYDLITNPENIVKYMGRDPNQI
ncbi:MAG TPA: SurA N-terminal domain-containing protein, partial [Candidatus Kapabacteria bacterium]|nr:SurA N-terminal domain-containing protein [Candidatus Kapabacteria bacterium]